MRLGLLEPSTPRLDLSGSSTITGTVSIGVNRKLFALAAIFFALVTAVGLSRAASSGNLVAALIIIGVIGIPCVLYTRGLWRRGPAISIGSEALGGFRVNRSIPWASIGDIYVSEQQSLFGMSHELVLRVRGDEHARVQDSSELLTSRVPTETVAFSIDQLAVPWNEIVILMEHRLGRRVATKRDTVITAAREK